MYNIKEARCFLLYFLFPCYNLKMFLALETLKI